MRRWHPLSKLVIVLGSAGLAAFWWFDRVESGTAGVVTAAASVERPAAVLSSDLAPVGVPVIADRVLPSLDAFVAMVEQPLFMPNRLPYVSGDDFSELWTAEWQPAPASGPPAPSFRFIGSVEENGDLRAIIGDGTGVRGLSLGQEVDGWKVIDIKTRRLIIGADDERLEFTILE